MHRSRLPISLLIAFICLASASAQDSSGGTGAARVALFYKFENPRFYEPLIEVDLAADGSGVLRFKRGESDEILDRKFKVMPATLDRILHLYEAVRFLESGEQYQDKKDFSHLGWVSLTARAGARERKARFNYTTQPEIRELAEIFRGLATQEMHLFDIDTAQRYQPLDLPKRLEVLENDLKLERVTEPEQLLAVLKEISGDDTQPLIARNHATRIIDKIKKGKFKTPIKK
jgi:hypothetical protein